MDPVESVAFLAGAGPATATMVAQRDAVVREFMGHHDAIEGPRLPTFVFMGSDARERVFLLSPDDDLTAEEAAASRPTLEVPAALDTLAMMRSARAEGRVHPQLATFEAAAALAGRN